MKQETITRGWVYTWIHDEKGRGEAAPESEINSDVTDLVCSINRGVHGAGKVVTGYELGEEQTIPNSGGHKGKYLHATIGLR